MDIRFTPIVLVIAFALAGCVGIDSDQLHDQGPDLAAAQSDAEPRGPVFKNETLEGNVTLTTFYVAAYAVVDGFQYFDVASGTRNITMDLSWSGSLSEIEMCAKENDYYADQDCATSVGGDATLTLSNPDAGRYMIRFFAETGAASGSYVIQVQHEIWADKPSGNADVVAGKTVLAEGA